MGPEGTTTAVLQNADVGIPKTTLTSTFVQKTSLTNFFRGKTPEIEIQFNCGHGGWFAPLGSSSFCMKHAYHQERNQKLFLLRSNAALISCSPQAHSSSVCGSDSSAKPDCGSSFSTTEGFGSWNTLALPSEENHAHHNSQTIPGTNWV